MNADQPIQKPAEDSFNYLPLVEQLAPHLIINPKSPSFVVGLEAPWGTGKSSFINLTKAILKKESPKLLVLDYSPWVYSAVDSLILGFCAQIAAQLETLKAPNYKKIDAAFTGFANAIKPFRIIPGSEPFTVMADMVLKGVARAASSASKLAEWDINTARKRVQDALSKANRSIVIFVDDIDRLAPEVDTENWAVG